LRQKYIATLVLAGLYVLLYLTVWCVIGSFNRCFCDYIGHLLVGKRQDNIKIEKVFTIFYRGEDNGQVKGHGIGMPLALKTVRLHGGDISIRSHKGEGTTFIVRMPHI
ncbi:MAG: ATP-binding protein, partial [Bacteroidales bacterium]|nr:ATP-binding protein [Bacteroidales bacterium]